MKPLAIAQLEIGGRGVRTLAPQKIELHLKEGTIQINGKSGEGKSTLLEVIKLATQGVDARRDNNLIRSGEEETEIRVKIAELKDPKGAAFYIRTRIKKSGEVISTFQIDEDEKLKNTDNPIPELGKLTVAKLQNLMSTTLTWGSEQFMSENPIAVREFIFETFSDELSKLGLLLKKGEKGFDDSINGKIEKALAVRDDIQREQSKLGAYAVNLEDLAQPQYVELSSLEQQKQVAIQELANARAELNNSGTLKQGKIQALIQETEKLKAQAATVKANIDSWNDRAKHLNSESLKRLTSYWDQLCEAKKKWFEVEKVFDLSSVAKAKVDAIEKSMNKIMDEVNESIHNHSPLVQINTELNADNKNLPADAQELIDKLNSIRKEYSDVMAKVKAIEESNDEGVYEYQQKVEQAEALLKDIDTAIARAEESNELWKKFDVLEKYKEADKVVKELYAERNRLYLQINCGVKGLSIGLLDEDGKRLGFFYNGAADPEYFGNKNAEMRPLTSYSKSQKIYIAAQLQCYLMSKKQYPLNVLCVDDTGMDKRVHQLWNSFANKYGLLILVTSTNDKTLEDIGENEILIEGGEIYVKP